MALSRKLKIQKSLPLLKSYLSKVPCLSICLCTIIPYVLIILLWHIAIPLCRFLFPLRTPLTLYVQWVCKTKRLSPMGYPSDPFSYSFFPDRIPCILARDVGYLVVLRHCKSICHRRLFGSQTGRISRGPSQF